MISLVTIFTLFGATSPNNCTEGNFLSFPTWYHYLPASVSATGTCSPQLNNLSDVWLIGAAVLEIMLRIAAIAAVAYIIYGGVTYTLSQGDPDKTKKAKGTIVNGLGGLAVAVSATAAVTFIAGSIH